MLKENRYSEYEYEEEEEGFDDPEEQDNDDDDSTGGGEAGNKGSNQNDEIELDDGTKVSQDELKKGYMRQADYTRKTQEIAKQKKGEQDPEGGDGKSKYPKEDVEAAKYFAKIAKDELGLMTKEDFERERAIDSLEKNINTTIATAKKDGIKLNKDELIGKMKEQNLPPDVAYRELKREELMEIAIKKSKGSTKYSSDKGGKPKPTKKDYDVSTQDGLEKFALDQLK